MVFGVTKEGEDNVDQLGGLISIIRLSSGDLVNIGQFVIMGELGRTAISAVFLI